MYINIKIANDTKIVGKSKILNEPPIINVKRFTYLKYLFFMSSLKIYLYIF